MTTISKPQSLTLVRIKDCTLRVPNKTTTLFLLWATIKAIFIHWYLHAKKCSRRNGMLRARGGVWKWSPMASRVRTCAAYREADEDVHRNCSQIPTCDIYRQMYFVHLYGLHVYCALVDLDSSGSPGVRPTPGLTSSTQVVCVCVRAYTDRRTHTTLTPAKIEKYTRQNPYLYPCQNIASQASNKR